MSNYSSRNSMTKRPITWGFIGLSVGLIGWVVFVVFSVLTLGKFRLFANIFGYVFLLSIPAGALAELVRWLWRWRSKK